MKRNNKYEYASNIRSHYVGDNYLQVMLPYKKAITVIDEHGVLFHKKKGSYLTINKYLNDERKNKFPYSNIPEHKMITSRGVIRYTNQLLEFNKPYIIITSGLILEEYAVKNDDDAILVTKAIVPQEEEKKFTLDELREFVYRRDSIYKKFSFDSGIYDGIPLIPEETKIIKGVRDFFFKNYTNINHSQLLSEWGQCSIKRSTSLNDSLCNFLKDNYPLEDILNAYVPVILNDCIIVYKDDNGINSVKAVESAMEDIGSYRTIIYNFPITHYTLEEAKSILQANKNRTTKEPRINSFLNKGIDKELIKLEKEQVKELTRKNKRKRHP